MTKGFFLTGDDTKTIFIALSFLCDSGYVQDIGDVEFVEKVRKVRNKILEAWQNTKAN